MKIAFHARQLGLRGTEIAIFDYARYNEELLGNDSVIVYDACSRQNDERAVRKFRSRFRLLPYKKFREVDGILEHEGVDALHALKSGERDGQVAYGVPTLVHAVFPVEMKHRHGTRYAFISEWLSEHCSGGTVPYVPHIIDMPPSAGDLRSELGIPADALVLGGYGGSRSFDIPFVPVAMHRALDGRRDLWFVFMNFTPFIEHPRVIFLEGSANMEHKSKFIETCDAMLHARLLGESFGIACGEFSLRNRPVMAYAKSKQRNHIMILGDKGFLYEDEQDLVDMMLYLDRKSLKDGDWDCYSQLFSPEKVMNMFKAVFLDGLSGDFVRPSLLDRMCIAYDARRFR